MIAVHITITRQRFTCIYCSFINIFITIEELQLLYINVTTDKEITYDASKCTNYIFLSMYEYIRALIYNNELNITCLRNRRNKDQLRSLLSRTFCLFLLQKWGKDSTSFNKNLLRIDYKHTTGTISKAYILCPEEGRAITYSKH